MATAIRHVLTGIAWLGMVAGGRALAQYGAPLGHGGPGIGQGLAAQPIDATTTPGQPAAVGAEAFGQTPSWLESDGFDDCSAGNCCAVCGGGNCCPPNWYFEEGVRVLSRGGPRLVITSFQLDTTTGGLVQRMTSKKVGFDGAAGYAARVGHYIGRDTDNRDQFVEFTYWGLNRWDDAQTVRGDRLTDSISFPDPVTFGTLFSGFENEVGGFNRADAHSLSVESQMNNFEINVRLVPRGRPDRLVLHPNGRWRRECQQGHYTSYLFGFRYMSLDDSCRFASRGQIDDGGVLSTVRGEYNAGTHNGILGLQIGVEMIERRCKWDWGVRAKVAPSVNFADQVSTVFIDAVGDPYATTTALNARRAATKDGISLIGEVGFTASYKFRPNFIGRVAYDFMWITGVALAPEQIVFQTDPPASLNDNGGVFSHGLSLGLEWTF